METIESKLAALSGLTSQREVKENSTAQESKVLEEAIGALQKIKARMQARLVTGITIQHSVLSTFNQVR